MEDKDFMQEALDLARMAAQAGEVPVGCVVVCDGKIVGGDISTAALDGFMVGLPKA